MFTCRCFKENCKTKPCAKCECEEKAIFCHEHILEHVLKPSPKGHNCVQQKVRPAEEIKQLVIQKLVEIKKDIKIYRKEAIASANEVINNFTAAFGKYFEQINEVDENCSKMIDGLLHEEEFLDFGNEDDMESVLKLDAQKANIKMRGWNINCCRLNYKEIKANISQTYEIPFNPFYSYGGVVEDEIESNELSFFRSNTSNFSTINLDGMKEN